MERFTLLSNAILLFASITKAQITKGSVYLGGSIGASTTTQESSLSTTEGKSKGFSINPTIGTAVKNNLIAGVNLNYSHGKTEHFLNNQDVERNGYGGGFFLRKYFPVANRLNVFRESGLNYFYQKWEYLPMPGYNYSSTSRQDFVSANIYPGLAINVFKSLYLETAFGNILQIGYSSSNSSTSNNGSIATTKQKDFSIQSSLFNSTNLNVGVRFIIPKKK